MPSWSICGDGEQLCKGDLIRARTLTGFCNDIRNPLMGSTGTPFVRNVEFETTFPDQEQNQLTKNRHGGRIDLMTPDPAGHQPNALHAGLVKSGGLQ